MKRILTIAKNELRNLFYTPVAWFTLIVFWWMCALFYTMRLARIGPRMYHAALEYPYLPFFNPGALTEGLITNPGGGMLANVLQYLYLFIPLLTMNTISREFNAGTHRLLYSSPLRMRELVAGKFLGVTVFNLLFILVLGAFMITAAFDIKSIEYPLLLSASLGVFLLLSAYAAIGFFASSLTRYPIVAAVISFSFLIILGSIDTLWQQYDFVRDLTSFLSLKSRTGRMLKGLITTKDIIYFLVIILMFVSFALFVLKDKVKQSPWYFKTGRFLTVFVLSLTAGYISSRQNAIGYLDVSAGKTNTLHPKTQQNLKLFDGAPMEVTLYTNLLTPEPNDRFAFIGLPANINTYLGMWEPYRRFKSDIQFKHVYYYAVPPGDSSQYKAFPGKSLKQIAGLVSRAMKIDSSLFIGPEEVRKIIDPGIFGYVRGSKISWKDSTVFINFFPSSTGSSVFTNVQLTSEPAFNAAFKRLAGEKMPHIGFITGELERSIVKTGEREYSWLNSLRPLGFDIDTLNLATENVPADMNILVLADPKRELSEEVVNKLHSYIDEGGNMFILGEPGKQYVLNPLLQKLGVNLMPGQLVRPSFHQTPDAVPYYESPAVYDLGEEYNLAAFRRLMKFTGHQIPSSDTQAALLFGATGLSYNKDSDFTATPLFPTIPERTWLKMGKLVQDSVPPVFNEQEGDQKENAYNTALQLTRKRNGKEQRIVIAGDADFVSGLRLGQNGRQDRVRAIFSWLNYNRYPAYTLFPFAEDNWLKMTPSWVKLERLIYLWIMPSLLMLLGIVILVRRKRR
ncbi:Gldg family protein [Pseudobacter ginsenosidimutans]|uniref:ABC-2 type transport system permease protein n=1 Tax=Pseudobacter ginsenosidimutans TaxID=661488 RepID=A0A4Q7MCD2_9BACT|nr:Gldg family protein [Pseudobacter ginsenosidimutans]QEC45212.1 ABC transporter permease subunit [Pseudobacter ginsenosidimutans]RZS65481.1 ABC-2 type transport system permease protein [Pseudobacter ginsenosidimutans]